MLGLRNVLKKIIPEPLRRVLRAHWSGPFEPTWDGIYPHLRDVPADGKVFGDKEWIKEMARFAGEALVKQRKGIDPGLWHNTLAVLAGAISAERGNLAVLDFGGAVGTAYIQLRATLTMEASVRVHVVDQEDMCVAGRQLFEGDPRISFHSSLENLRAAPDVVYANSVLPYIEDYAGLLRRLAEFGARYMLIARFAGGSFPTYATRQLNRPGRVMPYWFHNTGEIKDILATAGYVLAYEGLTGPTYDQRNFPESHRVGRMRDLLFRKIGPKQ